MRAHRSFPGSCCVGVLVFGTLVGNCGVGGGQEARPATPSEALIQPCLDYGRSFLNTDGQGDPTHNSVRFWVESRCVISDPQTGKSVELYQAGSCKSEDTFAKWNLFNTDGTKNYDFLPIFSQEERLIFRRAVQRMPEGQWPSYRTVQPTSAIAWGRILPSLRKFTGRVLADPEQIYKAIRSGKVIVGQTSLRNERTGRTAVIEYPIKTINWRTADKAWQVDTGPILLPDLSVSPDQSLHKIELAYIAFNTFEWADFVVERPTTVADEQVYHYSGLVHKQTRNVLLALDED